MNKIIAVARREFAAMVATKAFLLSITLMPILMFGGIVVATMLQNRAGDVTDRRLVIADGSGGELFGDLQQAVADRDKLLAAVAERAGDDAAPAEPKYVLERFASDALSDADRVALSNRVRDGEIKAFVEIPASILDDAQAHADEGIAPGAIASPPANADVLYYGTAAELAPERRWLEIAIDGAVKARRFKELQLDAALVARATADVDVESRGLVREVSGGRVSGGEAGQAMTNIFLPFGFMMLMFMIIMLSAQPLLESAMEEKNGRIAEVLLGSVSSFDLMLGKLLGNVAGSLTAVGIYASGGLALAWYKGWADMIPWDLVPWFLVFQVLAVLLFSSIFMAVGASVSQLKEAQSMLLPVWLLMMVPMFTWMQMVREPNGPLAVGLSFFPPAAPLVMVVRLASEEVVPAWQIAASLVLLVAATLAVTYLAGRIFRVGMLWQGKTPKLSELVRWAWRG
jgi:ABC-2 type transport system permease protein